LKQWRKNLDAAKARKAKLTTKSKAPVKEDKSAKKAKKETKKEAKKDDESLSLNFK